MTLQERLPGLHAALPTPFIQGAVDPDALARNLERWNEEPLDGYLLLGTTGEAPMLGVKERRIVIETARKTVPSDRVLFVGTAAESTEQTVARTQEAFDLGADACLVRTPSAYAPWMTQDALLRHYENVADSAAGPILLYQFPKVTAVVFESETAARLAAHPKIVGLKESSGDVELLADLVTAMGSAGVVLTGSAKSFVPALKNGAAGGILAIGCLVPRFLREIHRLAGAGEWRKAGVLQETLLPLAEAIPGRLGIGGLKAALDTLGFHGGPTRPPLPDASREERGEIERLLSPFARG